MVKQDLSYILNKYDKYYRVAISYLLKKSSLDDMYLKYLKKRRKVEKNLNYKDCISDFEKHFDNHLIRINNYLSDKKIKKEFFLKGLSDD